MADDKLIDELNAADPLAGSEQAAIAQKGTTRRVTVATIAGFVVVEHGSSPDVARPPADVEVVIWVGSVDPDNAVTDDLLVRTDQLTWHRYDGAAWQQIVDLTHRQDTTNPHGVTAAQAGAVENVGAVPSAQAETRANQPAAGTAGRWFLVTDELVLERDDGANWQQIVDLTHRQDTTNPHSVTAAQAGAAPTPHLLGGTDHDADTLADLNALVSDATLDDQGDARPPQAHEHDTVASTIVSAAYTLQASDEGQAVKADTSGGAFTITIPSGLTVGAVIHLLVTSTNTLTVAPGSGVTLQSAGGTTGSRDLASQFSEARIWQHDTDVWVVAGSLA